MINQEDVGSTPTVPARIQCPHCVRSFSKMGIKSHIWRTHGDGKGFAPTKAGHPAWNKGLTKQTDVRVRQFGETLSRRIQTGEIKQWNAGLNKTTDVRLAKHAIAMTLLVNEKLEQGSWHNSFARSRKQTYAGQVFDGMWEVHLATWFDQHTQLSGFATNAHSRTSSRKNNESISLISTCQRLIATLKSKVGKHPKMMLNGHSFLRDLLCCQDQTYKHLGLQLQFIKIGNDAQ